jgi:uncharacterized protein
MKEVNEGLRVLAGLDQKLARVHRKLQLKPLALQNDQVKLEETQKVLVEETQKLKDHDLLTRTVEKDCKTAEADLLKSSSGQNAATSNDEYQAHQRRIDSLKEKISEFETAILEGMEVREELQKKVNGTKAVVTNAEKVLKDAKSKNAQELAEIQANFDAAVAARQTAVNVLETDDRAKYERVYQKHGANTLVVILNGICQGCYVNVRPNDLVQVESGRKIVYCGDCGKILYLG